MKKLPIRTLIRISIIVLAGLIAWFTKTPSDAASKAAAQTATSHEAKASDGSYTVYLQCKLVESKYNDGDSFLVQHAEGQTEFRLYYVDTPETRDKPYADHKKRVAEQGQALGGLDYHDTLTLGNKAKKFTLDLLKNNEFQIFTSHELVFDGPRQYAFVQVKYNGKVQWLHEILVKKGYARVHTRGARTPNGQSFYQHRDYLKGIKVNKEY